MKSRGFHFLPIGFLLVAPCFVASAEAEPVPVRFPVLNPDPEDITPDSFQFRGRATLAGNPAPVPEPGIILLLTAAGLTGLTQRRRLQG